MLEEMRVPGRGGKMGEKNKWNNGFSIINKIYLTKTNSKYPIYSDPSLWKTYSHNLSYPLEVSKFT